MRFALKMLLAVVLAGACLNARADLVDSIVAIVGNSIITYQQIQSIIIQQNRTLLIQSHNMPEEYRKLRSRLQADVLQSIENQKMILHEFSSAGFKIPENIIEDYVQDRIRDAFHDDRVEMRKALEMEGLSEEDYRQQLHDEFIVMLMRQKFLPDPIISPLKVETYYKVHNDQFKLEDQVKMRLIVLNRQSDDTNGTVRRRMEEILSQIKEGADFGELAKSYSDGSQRTEGGETGWQQVSTLNKILVEATKDLKPGQYSGVIEGPDAYFLILLEERKAANIRPLTEVRGEIEKTLLVEEKKRLFDRWMARLRRKTFVENF